MTRNTNNAAQANEAIANDAQEVFRLDTTFVPFTLEDRELKVASRGWTFAKPKEVEIFDQEETEYEMFLDEEQERMDIHALRQLPRHRRNVNMIEIVGVR